MSLEPWIETHGGKRMWFLNPEAKMVDIDDIAHSLSNQCRFSGHTSRFYSVAEHSMNVAMELFDQSPVIRMQGLLHDASEAYLLDIPSPVKIYLTNYKELEEKIMQAIFDKYNLVLPLDYMVKEADSVMLKREAEELLPSRGKDWINKYPTLWTSRRKIVGMKPADAKSSFILWFEYLTKELKNYATRTEETF